MEKQLDMKYLLLSFCLMVLQSCTSEKEISTFEKLKEYEGLYEYHNNSKLEMAVSPRDSTSIFALLGGSKYQLKLVAQDTFLNASEQKVVFIRNDSGNIIGYQEDGNDELLKLLTKEVYFPKEMWYPRLGFEGNDYTYQQPTGQNDGLIIGNIEDTPINTDLFEKMIKAIIDEEYQDIHSVLIIYNGKLVAEEYFYEYDIDTPHPMRSATKSYISLLAGIALDQHIFKSTDEKVYPYFDGANNFENFNNDKNNITLKHLLTQTSGLDCNDWDWNSAGNESKMAYENDWIKFILDLPMIYKPGDSTQYCSGGVITIGRMIEEASHQDLKSFADNYLFGKLGVSNYDWHFKPDLSSAETFCQLSLRPRDIAKFMLMIDNKGRWNGKQIVSSDWVTESTNFHVTLDNTEYGYLWWRPYLQVENKRFDAILATGNGGQKAYIWKDLNLITIFNGGNYNKDSRVQELLVKYILPSFEETE